MKIYRFILILLILLLSANIYAQKNKIALLYSEKTLSLPTENSAWLIENFYHWELFLIQNKFSYEVIKDGDLEDGLNDDFSLLILPVVKYLNNDALNSIKQFMRDGNSVLATMALGVYESDGKWKSWSNMEDLFGVRFISEIPQKEVSKVHTILGGNQFSTNIPAGFRLQLTTYDKPIEVKINSSTSYALGYFVNSDALFEGKQASDYTTSMVYGKYGKGNFVWLGFESSAVVGAKEHQSAANQLMVNVLNWLNNKLVVQLETWPGGKKSAAVISCDVEFKFNLINNALDLIERENVPAQFYILTESIDYPSFKRLLKIGDIGFHGDGHDLFKWQDYDTQFNRLSSGIDYLEKISSKKLIAFRPPETFYDNVTLDVMNSLGVNVLSSDFIEDRAVPQFLKSHPNLLVIPKTGYDDYDIFYRLKIEQTNKQSDRYLLDFLRTYDEGGLYSLNFHTQMQCQKEFVDALRKPIQEIKTKDVWITTHNKVYKWWVNKENVKLNLKAIDDESYSLEIENKGNEIVDELILSLYKKNISELTEIKLNLEGKEVDNLIIPNQQKIRIQLPVIYPNEVKKLNISF